MSSCVQKADEAVPVIRKKKDATDPLFFVCDAMAKEFHACVALLADTFSVGHVIGCKVRLACQADVRIKPILWMQGFNQT